MNCDTWRCQRACHQSLLNALASSVFWSPHNGVHPRGCRRAFIEDATFWEDDGGVCREPPACCPSCRMEQSIHHHVSEQQTSAYSGSTLDFGSRFKDFAGLRIGALCLYYLSGSPPCAVSFTKTWVNQPITRVHH